MSENNHICSLYICWWRRIQYRNRRHHESNILARSSPQVMTKYGNCAWGKTGRDLNMCAHDFHGVGNDLPYIRTCWVWDAEVCLVPVVQRFSGCAAAGDWTYGTLPLELDNGSRQLVLNWDPCHASYVWEDCYAGAHTAVEWACYHVCLTVSLPPSASSVGINTSRLRRSWRARVPWRCSGHGVVPGVSCRVCALFESRCCGCVSLFRHLPLLIERVVWRPVLRIGSSN
jgi:hypothetical protein